MALVSFKLPLATIQPPIFSPVNEFLTCTDSAIVETRFVNKVVIETGFPCIQATKESEEGEACLFEGYLFDIK